VRATFCGTVLFGVDISPLWLILPFLYIPDCARYSQWLLSLQYCGTDQSIARHLKSILLLHMVLCSHFKFLYICIPGVLLFNCTCVHLS